MNVIYVACYCNHCSSMYCINQPNNTERSNYERCKQLPPLGLCSPIHKKNSYPFKEISGTTTKNDVVS